MPAVAMITPGPVVITVAFIGYLVGGPVGATLAAFGVFLPCYLFVIVPAPYFRRYAANRQLKAFVDGVTAANWFRVLAMDGFHCQVDPGDVNTVYAEGQYGELRRVNLDTGAVERPAGEAACVRTYGVELEGDELVIELPAGEAPCGASAAAFGIG